MSVYKSVLRKLGLVSFPIRLLKYLYGATKQKFTNVKLSIKYDCEISQSANIVYDDITNFKISRGVSIGSNTVIYCTNEDSKDGRISSFFIGEGSYIGEMNNIRVGGAKIFIGRKCLISQNVNIIGSNHSTAVGKFIMDQPWDDKKLDVIIGDDVWIGCGATILPGVTVGDGAIIAAGSVLTSDVERNAIFAGIPARFIKFRC